MAPAGARSQAERFGNPQQGQRTVTSGTVERRPQRPGKILVQIDCVLLVHSPAKIPRLDFELGEVK